MERDVKVMSNVLMFFQSHNTLHFQTFNFNIVCKSKLNPIQKLVFKVTWNGNVLHKTTYSCGSSQSTDLKQDFIRFRAIAQVEHTHLQRIPYVIIIKRQFQMST